VAAPAEDAHPLALLGQVHELEVDGEGLGNCLGTIRFEAVNNLDDLAEPLLCLGSAAPAQLDGRPPQPLDVLQQALTVGFLEDLAEDRAEQANLSPQWGGDLFQVGVGWAACYFDFRAVRARLGECVSW
jgi:hypothetical protein